MEKGERRREKGAGTREKALFRREVHNPRWPLASATTPLSSAACSRTAPAQASSRRSFPHRRRLSNYSLVVPPPPSSRVTRPRFANPYFRSLLFSSRMLPFFAQHPTLPSPCPIAGPFARALRPRPLLPQTSPAVSPVVAAHAFATALTIPLLRWHHVSILFFGFDRCVRGSFVRFLIDFDMF